MMQTRTLLASTFLVLLSACSAECSCGTNNNDDGEGGSGGSNVTVTGTTTGGDAGGSPNGTGGAGGGEGGSGQGGSGGDGTGGGTGGAGGGPDLGGYCALGCEEAVDCCGGNAECPGEYPNNVECVENLCVWGGCSTNDECTFGGALPDYACFDIGGLGSCLEACEVDEDCSLAESQGWTCSGVSDDGNYCVPPPVDPVPCETDDDCQGFGTCQDDGSCSCAGDEECTTEGYVCVE